MSGSRTWSVVALGALLIAACGGDDTDATVDTSVPGTALETNIETHDETATVTAGLTPGQLPIASEPVEKPTNAFATVRPAEAAIDTRATRSFSACMRRPV